MKTDELINQLTEASRPVKVMPGYLRSVFLWSGVTLFWLALVSLAMGHMTTRSFEVARFSFFIKITLPLLVGFLAGITALGLAYPDRARTRFIFLIPGPLFILALFSFITNDLIFTENTIAASAELREAICIIATILFAALPLILLLYHLKQGALLNPTWGVVLATLSAVALGVGGVNLACDVPAPFHALAFHYLPALLLALPVVALGVKRLRW